MKFSTKKLIALALLAGEALAVYVTYNGHKAGKQHRLTGIMPFANCGGGRVNEWVRGCYSLKYEEVGRDRNTHMLTGTLFLRYHNNTKVTQLATRRNVAREDLQPMRHVDFDSLTASFGPELPSTEFKPRGRNEWLDDTGRWVITMGPLHGYGQDERELLILSQVLGGKPKRVNQRVKIIGTEDSPVHEVVRAQVRRTHTVRTIDFGAMFGPENISVDVSQIKSTPTDPSVDSTQLSLQEEVYDYERLGRKRWRLHYQGRPLRWSIGFEAFAYKLYFHNKLVSSLHQSDVVRDYRPGARTLLKFTPRRRRMLRLCEEERRAASLS